MTRKALLAKIKAMLAMTVENGCTEAEALAAMTIARKWMAEHDLTDEDFTFGGEQVRAEKKRQEDRNRIRFFMLQAVAKFCNCEGWTDYGRDDVVICGLESDTVFAHWLLDTLEYFVLRELAAFLARTRTRNSPSVRRIESNGFVMGCAARIVQRLDELTPKAAIGRGLVVARNALIRRHMQELGIKLKPDNLGHQRVDNSAYDAGLRAGDGAQFNRPLNGGAAVKEIGDLSW